MIELNYLCRDNSHAYTCLNQNNDEVKFMLRVNSIYNA